MAQFVAYANLMAVLGPEDGVDCEDEAAAAAHADFMQRLDENTVEIDVVPIDQKPQIAVIKHDEIIILVDGLWIISREKALALFEAGLRGEPANVDEFGGRPLEGPFCTFLYDDDWCKEHLAEVIQNLKQAINPPKETPGGQEDHHNPS